MNWKKIAFTLLVVATVVAASWLALTVFWSLTCWAASGAGRLARSAFALIVEHWKGIQSFAAWAAIVRILWAIGNLINAKARKQ